MSCKQGEWFVQRFTTSTTVADSRRYLHISPLLKKFINTLILIEQMHFMHSCYRPCITQEKINVKPNTSDFNIH